MYHVVVDAFLIATVLIIWGVVRLYDLEFPLHKVEPNTFHAAVASSDMCPFRLQPQLDGYDYEGLLVEGGGGLSYFFLDKLKELGRLGSLDGVEEFLRSQLSIIHLYEEIILSEKFWFTTCCLAVVNILVFLSILEPNLRARPNEEFQNIEKEAWQISLRRYVLARFLVVSFVVVRSQTSIQREKLYSANLLVQAVQRRLADSTIFAIWYSLLWSIGSITSFVLRRFEWLLTLERDQVSRNVFKKLGLIMLACFGAAGSGVFVCLLATGIIHPLYSIMMILEITNIFVKSFYGFVLIGMFLHDDGRVELSTITTCKYFLNNVTSFIVALTYGMFIAVGTILNGKLLPLTFIPIFSRYVAYISVSVFKGRQAHSSDIIVE